MTKEVSKERAAVGRERRLALALRALMDGGDDTGNALVEAEALLVEFGYGGLKSIPAQLSELNQQLQTAVEAGDFATVSEVSAEMARVQAGKFRRVATDA